jgi:hypothetical protein
MLVWAVDSICAYIFAEFVLLIICACICAVSRFGGSACQDFCEGTTYSCDLFSLSRKWYISWWYIHFHDGFVLPRNYIWCGSASNFLWRIWTLMKIIIPVCFRPSRIIFMSCFRDFYPSWVGFDKPDDAPFSWRWLAATKKIRDGWPPQKLNFRGVRFVRVIAWWVAATE